RATSPSSRARGIRRATRSPRCRRGIRSATSGTAGIAWGFLLRRELGLLLLALAFPVCGQDKLISGPGSTLTETKCKICHELQHIRRTPLSRGEWADNLKSMRERGTPMTDEELAVILDYLATYYSRDPAPPPAPDTLAGGGGGDPVAKLLDAHACSGCHTLDKRVVGPSFREIARRYSGDAGAAARLAA